MIPNTTRTQSTPIDKVLAKLPSNLAHKLYHQDPSLLDALNKAILDGAFSVDLFTDIYKSIHHQASIFPSTYN